MGASVFFALRDALKPVSEQKILQFDSPATVERIRMICDDQFSKNVSFKNKNKDVVRKNLRLETPQPKLTVLGALRDDFYFRKTSTASYYCKIYLIN